MLGNLSIRSKLLALLAVPVAGTALLGVTGLAAAAGERSRAAEERRVAAVVAQAAAAVHELQEERALATAVAAGEGGTAARGAPVAGEGGTVRGALDARRRRVDRALAAYRAGVAGLAPTRDPALDRALAAAAERLDRLPVVRAGVDGQLVPPERVVDDHDALVAAMLGATHGLAGQLEGPAPARAARLLLAVAVAKEATGQERTLLATTPPPPGPALAAAAAVARSELNRVRGAAGDRLEEVDRALGTPGVRRLRRLELELLEPAPRPAAVTGDLAHLLAELLDNAAAFSSPAAPISVSAAADGDGYLVEVGDRGLGMTDQELAWANQRLAGRGGAAPAGVAAGDRLGLVVVARLAARNGFGVRLGRSAAGGVTAAVRLPAAALESGSPVPARLL